MLPDIVALGVILEIGVLSIFTMFAQICVSLQKTPKQIETEYQEWENANTF